MLTMAWQYAADTYDALFHAIRVNSEEQEKQSQEK